MNAHINAIKGKTATHTHSRQPITMPLFLLLLIRMIRRTMNGAFKASTRSRNLKGHTRDCVILRWPSDLRFIQSFIFYFIFCFGFFFCCCGRMPFARPNGQRNDFRLF